MTERYSLLGKKRLEIHFDIFGTSADFTFSDTIPFHRKQTIASVTLLT